MVKALITTLPKSGTHLLNLMVHGLGLKRYHCPIAEASAGLLSLERDTVILSVQRIADMLSEMPEDAFTLHHIPYSKALMKVLTRLEVRPIALVRNPLDFVVSLAHHLRATPASDTPREISLHQMQHWVCNGSKGANGEPPVAKRYFRMLHGWTIDERVLLLRFEYLVGVRGGGHFSDQIASGLALRDFLGADMSTGELARILIASYKPGIALFRKGQIGSWRREMMRSTAEQIRLLYKSSFEPWGYDRNGELLQHAGARSWTADELDALGAALIQDIVALRGKMHRMMETAGEPAQASALAEAATDDD